MADPASTSQIPAQVVALSQAIHGVVALWGLIETFFGFKIFKVTVRILMAFAGAGLGAYVAVSYQPESLLALGVGAGAGLIVGLVLGWFMYKLGIFVLGFFLGTVIAAPFSNALGPDMTWAVAGAAGLVCGLITLVLINLMVMAATSLTGAFRLVYGVAFFFGGPSLLMLIQDPNQYGVLARDEPLLAGITLLVGAIGFYFQYASNKPRKKEE